MSSFIETPKPLKGRHSLFNIRNNDFKCFAYSILAHFFPAKSNRSRVSKYKHLLSKLNMEGIDYPVKLIEVPKFESLVLYVSTNRY